MTQNYAVSRRLLHTLKTMALWFVLKAKHSERGTKAMFQPLTFGAPLSGVGVNRRLAGDFFRARAKADRKQWIDRLLNRSSELPDLADALDGNSWSNQHDCGIRIVEIRQIIGSVGRHHDFDRSFMPRRDDSKERWLRIDDAVRRGNSLPPIELIKLGDQYYVEDGNHRVSVANFHKQQFLEAHIREIMLN